MHNTDTRKKAGDGWLEYINQFPSLKSFWEQIPEPTNIYLRQQIDIFACKYPSQQTADTDKGIEQLQNQLRKHEQEVYNLRNALGGLMQILEVEQSQNGISLDRMYKTFYETAEQALNL